MTVDGMAWALLHSAWQGAVIAGLAGLALRTLHGVAAEVRYRVLGGLLALQVGSFLATIGWLAQEPAIVLPSDLFAVRGPVWPQWLVVAWGCGVVALSARLAAGLWTVQRWQRRAIPAPPELLARFERLRIRMGIEREVLLGLVPSGLGPMAVGLIRPAVLLPSGLLVQLPPDQLEAILLHELAHVRRLDWLVNLAQSVAETLLFHHPATWWLSHRIRHERELCCDAMAAGAVRDPLLYARALTELDALRVLPSTVPATGGNLMDRILRIVGAPLPPHRNPWVVPAVVIGLLLGGVSVAARGTSFVAGEEDGLAAADPEPEEEAADERPKAVEDVGASVLDMLAGKLEEGARKLEDNADRRYRRRHPEAAAPLPPIELAEPSHDHDHDHAGDGCGSCGVRVVGETGDGGCSTVVTDGARVRICDRGAPGVSNGFEVHWEAYAEAVAAAASAWEAQAAAAGWEAQWEAQAAEWEAQAAEWEAQWEAQAEALAAEWEASGRQSAEAWAVREAARAAAREAEWRARVAPEAAREAEALAREAEALAREAARDTAREAAREAARRSRRGFRSDGWAPPAPPAPPLPPVRPLAPLPPAPPLAPAPFAVPDPSPFEAADPDAFPSRGVPVEIEVVPLPPE